MSERHRNLTGITWHQVDVRDMGDAIPDKTVDLAFDKSTLDAMIYGSPWNPPEDVKIGTGRYLAEVRDSIAWLSATELRFADRETV